MSHISVREPIQSTAFEVHKKITIANFAPIYYNLGIP